MEWIHLTLKGIFGTSWWITLYKSPAPDQLGWTQALLSPASLQLEGEHFQNLLSGKDKFSTCCITIALKTWGSQINSSEQNRVVLVVPHSKMTSVMTTSSPLEGLCLQGYQLRWGSHWYLHKGMALLPFSLAATPHLNDFSPILFCCCVPFIPSPHCSKLPVSGHSTPWSPHLSSLSSQSLKWSLSPKLTPSSWKVLFRQHAVLWHTQPSPSWLMSTQGFNGTGGITAQPELKYSYITASSTNQVEKNY